MSEPGTASRRRAEASRLISFGRAAALAGGGFGWLGASGEIDASQPRPLYVNARMTHVFALAHLAGADDARPLAAAGLQALMSSYADGRNGGWFSSLDLAGRVIGTAKTNYGPPATGKSTLATALATHIRGSRSRGRPGLAIDGTMRHHGLCHRWQRGRADASATGST